MSQLQVKIRLLDEVWCVFVGLHGDHAAVLYDKYGIYAPNYFFHPLVKLGRWDGKTRFFQKNGKTYIFLLEEILTYLKRFGYHVTFEDLRHQPSKTPQLINANVFSDFLHPDTEEPIILRYYQVDAINACLEHGYGTVVAATGAGKTLITAALTYAYGLCGLRVFTIVPNQDLLRNTKRDYLNCGLDVGEYSGKDKSLDRTHVVGTWQALNVNPGVIAQFDVVIIDETHMAKATTIQKLLSEHGSKIPFRFGVTGTIPKEKADALSVFTVTGPIRYEIPAHVLIKEGVLAQPQVDIYQLEEDLRTEYDEFVKEFSPLDKPPTYPKFKDEYYPDFAAEKAAMDRSPKRIDWIIELLNIKRDQTKGNTLCLVESISMARKLAARIPGAIVVNGADVKKQKDRQAIYDLFKNDDNLCVIATFKIASVGLNIPRIFNLVTVDVGKSFIKIIQSIGRSLRTAVDKKKVNISDICSDLKYGKRHLAQRITYYKEAQYPHKKYKINYSNSDISLDTD